MSGDEPPRPTQKEARTRRLEEQLRDNLRKRKELSRARRSPVTQGPGDGANTREAGDNDTSDDG